MAPTQEHGEALGYTTEVPVPIQRSQVAQRGQQAHQLVLLMVMVGNFEEKSLPCCAMRTATARAMDL